MNIVNIVVLCEKWKRTLEKEFLKEFILNAVYD